MSKYESLVTNIVRRISKINKITPIIYLVTEDRDILESVFNQAKFFSLIGGNDQPRKVASFKEAIWEQKDNKYGCIKSLDGNATYSHFCDAKTEIKYYYIRDFHLEDKNAQNSLFYNFISSIEKKNSVQIDSNLFILAPIVDIPQGYESYVEVINIPLPGVYEINQMIVEYTNEALAIEHKPTVSIEDYENCACDSYVQNLKGLNIRQIRSILHRVYSRFGRVSSYGLKESNQDRKLKDELYKYTSELILATKQQMVETDPSVEFVKTEGITPPGGMDGVLGWIRTKKKIIENPKLALERDEKFPKGILVAGLPGTGKSLLAKNIANELGGIPLIQFKLSSIMAGIVGSTESNLSRALKKIEAVAPCVVWIDEIEKELNGTSGSGESDGGVGSRCLAKLLTWMQENNSQCFICATANNVSQLPSELMRTGRFSRNYYSFFPMHNECVSIFKSIMERIIKRIPKLFDNEIIDSLDKLGNEIFDEISSMPNKFFTGSDIESMINDAKSVMFNSDEPIPYSYKKFKATLIEVADTMKPYGESHIKESAQYWLSLKLHPFINVAMPIDKPSNEKYKYMLIDFEDMIMENGKYKWRDGMKCNSDFNYDKNMYDTLRKNIMSEVLSSRDYSKNQ